MGTSVSRAILARIRTIVVACATFALALGLAPATSFAVDDETVAASFMGAESEGSAIGATPNSILASTLTSDGVSVISADVMLGDATVAEGPNTVIGSFTVDGLTFAVNLDGVTLVSVDLSVILSVAAESGEVEESLGGAVDDSEDSSTALRMTDALVAIPSSITYAGVTYPVTAIGPYAFYLSGATQVAVPASIASVDDRAFRSSDVERVTVNADNPNLTSFDGALYSADLTSLLLIPEGRVGSVSIPSEAEVVQASKFSHCSLVDAISVDGDGAAFASWEGLLYDASGATLLRVPAGATEITIREGCTTIAAGAMEGCAKLERINAPSTVTSISPNVFESVPTVSLPAAAIADNPDVADDEAEVAPRRVVASLMSLEAPLALPDLGSTSASSSANGQLTAMVTLSVVDGDEPVIDAQKIIVIMADSTNTPCWEDLNLSVRLAEDAPEATLQAAATNAATYTVRVYANGHPITVKYHKQTSSGASVVSTATLSASENHSYTGVVQWHTSGVMLAIDYGSGGTYYYHTLSGSEPGYTFKGFGTSAAASSPLVTDTPGQGSNMQQRNITLYGIWAANRYTVNFDPNADDTSLDASSVAAVYDQDVSLPQITRNRYRFMGWDTESDGSGTRYQGSQARNLTTAANGTVTLYAQWELDEVNVSFDTSSEPGDEDYPGDVKPDKVINTADGQVEIGDPKRPGYVFQGWVIPDATTGDKEALDQDLVYQGDDGKWYVDASKLPDATDGKVELTARWTSVISVDVPSAVTFYADVVTQGNESREGVASSAFGQSKVANQSQVDLRVVGLESEAVETTDATLGADSILKKAAAATPATSASKLLSLYPSSNVWTAEELQDPDAVGGIKAASAVDFDLDDLLLEASFDADDFTIPAGDTLNMGYRLNLTETGQELDYDKLSTLEDGQSAAIANVSYTFAGTYIDPLTEPFWVENTDSALGPARVHGTLDIKMAADDLSAHADDLSASRYYAMYKSFLDNEVPFHLKLTVNGVTNYVEMLLIGICQDIKSDGVTKAGLTFQMKDLFAYDNKTVPAFGSVVFPGKMNTSNTNSGGWNSSYMRNTALRSTFYNYLDKRVQDSIAVLTKYQQLTSSAKDSATGTNLQKATDETVWLPSVYEVLGVAASQYNPTEGTSLSNYEPFQYQYFAKEDTVVSGATYLNTAAIKTFNSVAQISRTRSAQSQVTSSFCIIKADGTLNNGTTSANWGVAPCFAF